MSKENKYNNLDNNSITTQEDTQEKKAGNVKNNIITTISAFAIVAGVAVILDLTASVLEQARDLHDLFLHSQEYIKHVTVYIDEQSGDENTSFEEDTSEKSGMLAVPEGCYFVMGDSRSSSDNAFVSRDEIIARVDLLK